MSLVLRVLALVFALATPAHAYECFLIPNRSAAAYAAQSRVFAQDVMIIAAAQRGNGVIYAAGACQVTAQASPNMSVHVAGCSIAIGGSTVSVSAADPSIAAANATNPRIDLVSVNSSGTVVVTTGTPAAEPEPPTIPESGGAINTALAFVYVPAADTAINANQIVDKRPCVEAPGGGGGGAPTDATYWTSTANGTLSAEVSLGALTTGLLLNTVSGSTGTPSAYAGTSCTNQFPRSLNASGAATCASVALGADVSGDLPFANLTQGSALSVLGVAGNSTADHASIAAANDAEVLRRSGTSLGFGTLATGGIADDAVTDAKLRESAGVSVIGRAANSTGNPADIVASADGQVLRRAAGAVAFGALDLADSDAITGDLPLANLEQGAALSVLGVTGNSTADNASIAAGSDHQVLRRSGTAVAFGAVNLGSSNAVTGDLPYANLTPSSAASRFLCRGDSGAGDWQECDLGSGVAITGTTLSASGGGGGAPDNAQYLVAASNGTLTAERVTTDTATVAWDHGTAGQAKANVPDGSITFAKMQTIATDRLIGRDTASTGAPEEITVGGGLEFTGSAGIQRSALTGDVTASAGSNSTTIATNAVTTSKILDANVTKAKIENVAADTLLGRGNGGGAGAPQEITLGTGLSMSGTTLNSTGSGAPTDATYVALSTNGTLTNERVLTGSTALTGPGILLTDAGAGSTVTVSVPNETWGVLGADVTVNNSTVLVNATGVLCAIGSSATEKWAFEVQAIATANATNSDHKFGWTVPSGATVRWGTHGLTGATNLLSPAVGDTAVLLDETATATFGSNATSTNYTGIVFRGIIFGGGTGGNVQLQYAQATAQSNDSKLKAGTLVVCRKIAS